MEIVTLSVTERGYAMDATAWPAYVATVCDKVAEHILEFMEAPWRYDWTDRRCPHDARIDALTLPIGREAARQRPT